MPKLAAASEIARGRLSMGPPIAVIDIGSNSVRLVVYEAVSRSPTPVFNEKVLCGLGRNVATTGRLDVDAVDKALAALKRFRALCDTLRADRVHVLATAAARDAANGPEFIDRARDICRVDVELLSGKREAKLAALGVISGTYRPSGVVGDLGGGSLELADIDGHRVGAGVTLPLGGLALQDISGRSVKKAEKIVREALAGVPQLDELAGRTFYAVGGTWRALAKLHMEQRGYPLHVMHGYTLPTRAMVEFCRLLQRADPSTLSKIEAVSDARRALLPYGAVVLEHILRLGKPYEVMVSALGVREGLLFSLLPEEEQRLDPLLAAAEDLNQLRSRSPRHGRDLAAWSDRFMASTGFEETAEETRLRRAACLLADIGWRAHPDYRGEQSLNIIAHAAFVGIDHTARAFLALAVYFRHAGLSEDGLSPQLRELASPQALDHARILGASMRVAYLVSAAMPDVLPRAPLEVVHGKLVLRLDGELADLAGDRLLGRVRTLAKLIGREPVIAAG
ncbi:exopolyphosphatase [Blastochloris viridis]|uniref:exopolyphosphatase n=2 Tax=Blastochloris viridis TaxID=1079 RepID=A0A182CXB7_BLAVI|nr:exopolyphosphatase [Blastochloris viridis]